VRLVSSCFLFFFCYFFKFYLASRPLNTPTIHRRRRVPPVLLHLPPPIGSSHPARLLPDLLLTCSGVHTVAYYILKKSKEKKKKSYMMVGPAQAAFLASPLRVLYDLFVQLTGDAVGASTDTPSVRLLHMSPSPCNIVRFVPFLLNDRLGWSL